MSAIQCCISTVSFHNDSVCPQRRYAVSVFDGVSSEIALCMPSTCHKAALIRT